MIDRPSSRPLRFGDFELNVAAYELRRQGRPVRLERLAMDLLILLIDRRDQLVTRSEIVERLWGPDVFLEVDASVNTLVRKIRRALNDSVDDPRYIQTVQGKGYRFIAAADVVPAPAALPELQSGHSEAALPIPEPPALSPQAPPRRGRIRLALGLAALALMLFVAGRLAWGRLNAGPDPSSVTVAVMPFENLSGNPELDYVADGLAEETAASLGQIIDPQRVTVIGRIATRVYKGTRKSAAEIGRELRAGYLVEGTVQAEGDQLRVTSNLIRVRDQGQVWSRSYNREPIRMLEMQQELGTAVAAEISSRLVPERLNTLAQRQTRNPDANDLYLKGRSLWLRLTPDTTRRAIQFYRQATLLDPGYALAWSGIADALSAGPISGDARPEAVRKDAREAAERALAAGNLLAETHTSEAVRQFFLEWDWERSQAGFDRAIQINGNYAMAHRNLGVLLSHSGRNGPARSELGRALQLEPDAVNHALFAMIEFHAGDLEAAVRHARAALAFDADFFPALYHLAQAYEQMGRTELALETLDTATRVSNNNSKALSLKGYVLAKAGRRDQALDVLGVLGASSSTRYVPPYASALVHAGLGDRDAAFAWLEKAFSERDVHLIFLPVDPKWKPFRNDARFQDLLRRCGFTRRAAHARN